MPAPFTPRSLPTGGHVERLLALSGDAEAFELLDEGIATNDDPEFQETELPICVSHAPVR
jgi:hypothetical protein